MVSSSIIIINDRYHRYKTIIRSIPICKASGGSAPFRSGMAGGQIAPRLSIITLCEVTTRRATTAATVHNHSNKSCLLR
jgi:hypothetical protein